MPSLTTAAWSAWGAVNLPPTAAALEQDLAASVVKLGVRARHDARTAKTLGAEREGTGVIIEDTGLILTIGYLLLEAASILVMTYDGRVLPAQLAGFDHVTGFGLVRTTQMLAGRALAFGDPNAVYELNSVVIAAHPGAGGLSHASVVSRRTFTGWWEYALDNAIFTSPVRDHHSGAALLNASGELIGIGSLWVGDAIEAGAAFPGNMFVPTDLLVPILADLKTHGRRPGAARPWLGLYSEEVRGHVLVTQVLEGAPAARGGVQRGDVILAVGGKAIGGQAEFYRTLWASGAAGAEVTLQIWREKAVREIVVRSTDRLRFLRSGPGSVN